MYVLNKAVLSACRAHSVQSGRALHLYRTTAACLIGPRFLALPCAHAEPAAHDPDAKRTVADTADAEEMLPDNPMGLDEEIITGGERKRQSGGDLDRLGEEEP